MKSERIFIVQEYFQSRSLKTVQEERFNVEFPGKTAPNKKSILRFIVFNEIHSNFILMLSIL